MIAALGGTQSESEQRIDAVAALLGSKVEPWSATSACRNVQALHQEKVAATEIA